MIMLETKDNQITEFISFSIIFFAFFQPNRQAITLTAFLAFPPKWYA